MASQYSRTSPSPRYQELLAHYKTMHEEGEAGRNRTAVETYPGKSLLPHAVRIKDLIASYGAKTLLDYGCGKAMAYNNEVVVAKQQSYPSIAHFWAIEKATLYDPAYAPYIQLPTGTFDAVISTDVLEHCPEGDVPWILEEIFGYANMFVFANVACYRAQAHLPTGENAHCTLKDLLWWIASIHRVSVKFPAIGYEFVFKFVERSADGVIRAYNQILTKTKPEIRG